MRRVRLPRRRSVIRSALLAVGVIAALGVPAPAAPQVKHYPLESTDGLRVQNVAAEPAVLQGKKGVRITMMSGAVPQLAPIMALEFDNGVIEAEIPGAPAADGSRGFGCTAF